MTTPPPHRARVAIIGLLEKPEHRYLVDRLNDALAARAGDVVEVFLPVERHDSEGYALSALEAHYDQLLLLEEADLVITMCDMDLVFDVGVAYGLRKQILSFSPRALVLPEKLRIPIFLHVEPDHGYPFGAPFMIEGTTAINLEYEAATDAALFRLVDALRLLAPIYIEPHPQYEMLVAIASALKEKWRKVQR